MTQAGHHDLRHSTIKHVLCTGISRPPECRSLPSPVQTRQAISAEMVSVTHLTPLLAKPAIVIAADDETGEVSAFKLRARHGEIPEAYEEKVRAH